MFGISWRKKGQKLFEFKLWKDIKSDISLNSFPTKSFYIPLYQIKPFIFLEIIEIV